MGQFMKEAKTLAKMAGGSHKTVHDRIKMAERFSQYLQKLNIQVRDIQHLKAKHIESYITSRLEESISLRTLQNEMAGLRSIMRQAGRDKFFASERLTNSRLGLGGASRAGTKLAIPEDKYQEVISQAFRIDEGFSIALQLSRLMGLRSQEAVQCSASLKTWQKELSQGKDKVTIIFGTKGGRARASRVLCRQAITRVIEQAIRYTKLHGGKLIDKPDLRRAMNFWRSATTKIGLIGKYSPHSLRYAWAQDLMRHYLAEGFTRRESAALTSMDLGHGDGRGRYVERVYGLKTNI
ncbi:integrase domain-containing protein [Rouxiella silvae]|uniref:integrase domain-containing protein n=1 Tax=Rouxiella silvae TaxID=1646373 RepID=UPI0039F05E4C